MNSFWKKIILGTMIVALVVPPVLLTRPQKSDAFINCLLGQLFGNSLTKAQGAVAKVLSVPVHDAATFDAAAGTKSNTGKISQKECYMDFLVRVLANTIIKTMTKSIVNWINTGFQGSPSFVTDLDGFLADVGDQVIGQSIYELGALGEVLCSPFDLNLRLALGLSFSTSRRDRISCRLSDIQENMYNAFVGGSFGGDAGWRQFLAIQTSNQNNPYGSFIELAHDIDARIVSATGRETKQLEFGRGFFSFQDCKRYEYRTDPRTNTSVRGRCLEKGEIRTPGGVIEGQLKDALGSNFRELELADELNEIFGALVNVAINQVFTSSGLLGATKPRSGGGRSFLDDFASGDVAADYNRQLTVQTTELPAGLLTNPTGFSCSEFSQKIYSIEATTTPAYTNPPYNGQVVVVSVKIPPKTPTDPITYSSPIPTKKKVENRIVAWSVDDLERARAYCTQNPLEEATARVVGSDPDVPTPEEGRLQPQAPVAINLALNKHAYQSSAHDPHNGAQHAVDGIKLMSVYVPVSRTHVHDQASWWEVDLGSESTLDYITIYRDPSYLYNNSIGAIKVTVFADDGNGRKKVVGVGSDEPVLTNDPNKGQRIPLTTESNYMDLRKLAGDGTSIRDDVVPIRVPLMRVDAGFKIRGEKPTGRYVRIDRHVNSFEAGGNGFQYRWLNLLEVEVFGLSSATTPGTAGGVTGTTPRIVLNPALSTGTTMQGGFQTKKVYTIYAPKDQDISLHMRLEKRPLNTPGAEFKEAIFSTSPLSKLTVLAAVDFIATTTQEIITYSNTTPPQKSATGSKVILKNGRVFNIPADKALTVTQEIETDTQGLDEGDYRIITDIFDGATTGGTGTKIGTQITEIRIKKE